MTDIKPAPSVRYVRSGFGSYRVEVDGQVAGWVTPFEGWWPHRYEDGDWNAPGPFRTRREAAEWLLQETADD